MRLLLLSNAKREGSAYLEWALPHFSDFFKTAGVSRIVFVPFAGVTTEPDAYVEKVRPAFAQLGIQVEGVQQFADPVAAVHAAQTA
mgnify:FL=1